MHRTLKKLFPLAAAQFLAASLWVNAAPAHAAARSQVKHHDLSHPVNLAELNRSAVATIVGGRLATGPLAQSFPSGSTTTMPTLNLKAARYLGKSQTARTLSTTRCSTTGVLNIQAIR